MNKVVFAQSPYQALAYSALKSYCEDWDSPGGACRTGDSGDRDCSLSSRVSVSSLACISRNGGSPATTSSHVIHHNLILTGESTFFLSHPGCNNKKIRVQNRSLRSSLKVFVCLTALQAR